MNDLTKNVLVFIVIIVVLLSVVQGLSTVNTGQPQPVDYSDFLSRVQSGSVNIVEFSEDKTQIQFGDRKPFPYYTVNPETDTGPLVDLLIKNNVQFSAELGLWTTSATTPTVLTGAGSSGDYEAVSVPYPATVPLQAGGNDVPQFFQIEVTID